MFPWLKSMATKALCAALVVSCGNLLGLEEGKLQSAECDSSAQCDPENLCLRGTCSPICRVDGDCGESERCFKTALGSACVRLAALTCSPAETCGSGAQCDDGRCRTTCAVGCRPDEACENGLCVELREPSPAGSAGEQNLGGGGAWDGGTDGDAGAGGDANVACRQDGVTCPDAESCCSGSCDQVRGTCTTSVAECRTEGSSCTSPTECCGLTCVENACGVQCVSEDEVCASDDECCSGQCVEDACASLTAECKTLGNACLHDSDCCSGSCEDDLCASSSNCSLPLYLCTRDEDCCSRDCNVVGVLGTCASEP
jgi:hypothetical protein